jgi:hypothetical protein
LAQGAVTKKTHEATGFFFSALSIYRIFCLPEVGKKTGKPAVFLVTAREWEVVGVKSKNRGRNPFFGHLRYAGKYNSLASAIAYMPRITMKFHTLHLHLMYTAEQLLYCMCSSQ